jgi:putative transposase
MIRTYRYRLYPTGAQADALNEQLRSACHLYNAALQQRRDAWREHGVSLNCYSQQAEFPAVRAAGLLAEGANAHSQRLALRQLDRAFAAFFRRVKAGEKPGFPRFRSHRRFDTLTWQKGNGWKLDGERLRVQGVGSVRVKLHRSIPDGATVGEMKVTRSSDGRRWHACFTVKLDEPRPRPITGESVGIDLGVRALVTLSTGEQLQGPRPAGAGVPAVRRAARRVARRKKGSNRRRKAVALLARHREREANRRREHAHKLSRRLVDRFDLIAVENLHVRNMVRSARGTIEAPGVNVAQKRGLNRSIADQGWSQLVSMIGYKAADAGAQVVKVNPANTSRTCAECGAVDARSRRAEWFRCVACGHVADADVNAARNVLARALALDEAPAGSAGHAETDALAAVA